MSSTLTQIPSLLTNEIIWALNSSQLRLAEKDA